MTDLLPRRARRASDLASVREDSQSNGDSNVYDNSLACNYFLSVETNSQLM